MRFGINTFLFSCPFTNRSTRWFPQFKKWGFETVEISVGDLTHIDPAFVKDKLAQHGLVCGSVTPCLVRTRICAAHLNSSAPAWSS